MRFASFFLAWIFLIKIVQADSANYLVLSSESTGSDPEWVKVINA
jgi:hypothetical protein